MADAYLKNNETGALITRFLQYETSKKTNLIHNDALGGDTYIQIIGSGSGRIKATAYVQRDGKAAVESAMQDGTVLAFRAHGVTKYGRILSVSFGDRTAKGWFRASIEASVEEIGTL